MPDNIYKKAEYLIVSILLIAFFMITLFMLIEVMIDILFWSGYE
tara:strand:- start:617 stop:748 length:132 start_codon:yes stop_codon:yes gene_type:complete